MPKAKTVKTVKKANKTYKKSRGGANFSQIARTVFNFTRGGVSGTYASAVNIGNRIFYGRIPPILADNDIVIPVSDPSSINLNLATDENNGLNSQRSSVHSDEETFYEESSVGSDDIFIPIKPSMFFIVTGCLDEGEKYDQGYHNAGETPQIRNTMFDEDLQTYFKEYSEHKPAPNGVKFYPVEHVKLMMYGPTNKQLKDKEFIEKYEKMVEHYITKHSRQNFS